MGEGKSHPFCLYVCASRCILTCALDLTLYLCVISKQSHPKAVGLNTKPLPFFDELSKVFGVNHAMGADAVQPSDADSMLEP
ncbi:hypothetical protein LINPERPRIM_LOCUS30173 [Linum perenne]